MYITHEFEVRVPVDEAWKVLLDVSAVASCLPGASVVEVIDDRSWKGVMNLDLGAVNLSFEGLVRRDKIDPVTRTSLMWVEGRESHSKGAVHGTLTSTLLAVPEGTRVSMTMFLQVSGAISEHGSGMVEGLPQELVAQFAANLEERLTTTERVGGAV